MPILNLNEVVPRTFHSAHNLNARVPRTCFENILPGSCTENIYMNGPLVDTGGIKVRLSVRQEPNRGEYMTDNYFIKLI